MTRLSLRLAPLVGLATLALASDAMADAPKAPAFIPGPKVSIQAYGRQNPACRAWTNGCVLCTSDGNGHSQCSTPGIACEPHGLTCKEMIKP